MICPKCKKDIKPSSKFCGYCGNKFTVKSAPTITPPVHETAPQPVQVQPAPQPVVPPTVSVSPSAPTAKCPKCGSTSLQAAKKGVSVGKAAAGAIIAGPLGLLAGGIGMNDVKIICLNCGHSFEPHN